MQEKWKKQKIKDILIVLGVTAFATLFCNIFLGVVIQGEINSRQEGHFMPIEINAASLDKQLSFSIYPWSKYKKKDIHELSGEQRVFLEEKDLMGCIVDLVNYDEQIIENREHAEKLMYDNLRVLNAEGKQYYVLHQTEVSGIYVFAMINMEGELFSFHYVMDYKYNDNGEAVREIMGEYGEDVKQYSVGQELSTFDKNRELFIKNMVSVLTKYQNMNITTFISANNFSLYPNQVIDENGSIMTGYALDLNVSRHIYFYIDKKSKKFCGYHIETKQ